VYSICHKRSATQTNDVQEVYKVGAPISTYYQVLQLMTDKDNPAHVEIAKNALKPFNLFVVALYHPERHWELGRALGEGRIWTLFFRRRAEQ
jgi:hypothetical protein